MKVEYEQMTPGEIVQARDRMQGANFAIERSATQHVATQRAAAPNVAAE